MMMETACFFLFLPGKYRVGEDFMMLLKLLVRAEWLSKMGSSHHICPL